jgi:pyrimidine operon attenuation protein / uracil phosphoribosyltransferase
MDRGRIILKHPRFNLTLQRLAHHLIETYGNFKDTCLIGIQPRGVELSDRIYTLITELQPHHQALYGKLDITFYRDDFRIRKALKANDTEMDFVVDDKKVVLIDDVLYTGRTIQAALTALNHFGRPGNVELLVLIDRRYNREVPIKADYIGYTIDAVDEAHVVVDWNPDPLKNEVRLYKKKVI